MNSPSHHPRAGRYVRVVCSSLYKRNAPSWKLGPADVCDEIPGTYGSNGLQERVTCMPVMKVSILFL